MFEDVASEIFWTQAKWSRVRAPDPGATSSATAAPIAVPNVTAVSRPEDFTESTAGSAQQNAQWRTPNLTRRA